MDTETVTDFICDHESIEHFTVQTENYDTIYVSGEFGGENPSRSEVEQYLSELRNQLQDEFTSIEVSEVNERVVTLWIEVTVDTNRL